MPKQRDVSELRILTDRLQDIGLDGLEAPLWSALAHTALRTIRIAEWKLKKAENWDAFRVARGTRLKPWEDDVSDFLHRHLFDMYVFARLSSPHADIQVGYQERARVPHRAGPDVRRMDLIFRRKWKPGKIGEIAVESKRLQAVADIADHYLGDQGIGCLTDPVDGYTTAQLAFMLAYVVDLDRPTWENHLRVALAAASNPRISTRDDTACGGGPVIHSVVERPDTEHGSMLILHSILAFQS